MKRTLARLAVVLALIAAGLWLRATVFAPQPVSVRTVPVERGVVRATATNSKVGTVRARRRAGLSAGTAGIVVALEVERGDRIEAGAHLLSLDDATQKSEVLFAERKLELAREQHARSCIAAERAARELERTEQMARGDSAAGSAIVSEDRLDAVRTASTLGVSDCRIALANVGVAEAALEVARAELAKTVLVAPFAAIIADVSVEVGEWVTPSVPLTAAPDLIDAIDPSSLYISAPMDEVDARLLAVGQRAQVTIDPFPGRTFGARIVRIAPFVLDVEQQNRTLEIEVELDDAEFSATLLPGTSADVEIVLDVHEDVLRIPMFALMEGARVFVVEEGRLAEREVGTGIRNWDWVEVLGGLEEGEVVVTSLDFEAAQPGAEVAPSDARAEGPGGT